MKRKNGMTLIGLTIVMAGLVGCKDSPTAPAAFDDAPRPPLALVELVVQNATGADVVFYIEYGEDLIKDGSGIAEEVVSLGFVAAFGEEHFVLEPSLVDNGPARFVAALESGDEVIESEWMWLDEPGAVELLITRLGVLRTDTPGWDIDKGCPVSGEGLCR
jgi:hypothetical protein